MAGALYSRIKTWVSLEDLTAANLNAEFDNILNNLLPLMIDDYSTNVTQMQVQTDPGESGTESLATSLAGELARIRFIIKEITGKTYWYQTPAASLAGIANAVGTGATDNRLVSGRVRASPASQQPMFLVASGAARTVTVKGATTPFIYYVNGTEYQIDSDVTITNLTLAPSSNNTCLVNDGNASAQDWTKYTGEAGTEIPVDNMGSEISALTGKMAAFKIGAEYFIAEVTSTTRLTKARRGYFFDASDNPLPRVTYSDNATITLMKLTWVFATSSETLTATYNNVSFSKDEPSSPSIGDYWFDTDNNKWKVYGVGSFSDANATLVGACIQNGSVTIAARSFEFFLNYDSRGNVELMADTNTQIKSRYYGADINVWGTGIKNDFSLYAWDITAHLDSGVTEAASTYYYAYITEEGDRILSDVRPYDRREDLKGYYHPHQSWRCVGYVYNNGSSNFDGVTSYWTRYESYPIMPVQTTRFNVEVVPKIIPVSTTGGATTYDIPAAALWRGQVIRFFKTTSDYNAATLDGFGSESLVEGDTTGTTTTLNTNGEWVDLLSDGTSIYVVNRFAPSKLPTWAPTPSTGAFGTVASYGFACWRDGRFFVYDGYWTNGTLAGGVASLPLPVTIDTTANTGLNRGNTTSAAGHIIGHYGNVSGNSGYCVSATATDATLIYFGAINSSTNLLIPQVGTAIGTNSSVFALNGRVPVSGWKG